MFPRQGLAGASILSTRELMTLSPQARPWPELCHAGRAKVQLQQSSAGLSPLGAAGPGWASGRTQVPWQGSSSHCGQAGSCRAGPGAREGQGHPGPDPALERGRTGVEGACTAGSGPAQGSAGLGGGSCTPIVPPPSSLSLMDWKIWHLQLPTLISCPTFPCAAQSSTGKAFQKGGLEK